MPEIQTIRAERRTFTSTVPQSGPSSRSLLDYWRSHRTSAPTKTHLAKWERDPYDDETPREARARVARDLAEGRRCAARLLGGGPCSLLLPCATHGR